MVTIQEIKEMSNEQIMTEMKSISHQTGASNPSAGQNMAMMYIVMAKRKGIDPRPKVKSHGMLEKAEKSGWL
ncbi:hypothetical protein [Methanolobus halotolerans]|uniref:Uncharacterized protein n=1 Tax=Methanolobus halotolerans TaxID=2052935 RepID=A0A4E0PUX9_9EURY|nr:hypothetical protein [Methanolobus halotolerans]TGC08899.1 hypothetical protein CUN85_07640 [Methanolobus halotolerans]